METARNTQVTKRVYPGTDCAEEAIKATEISPHVFMRKVGLIIFLGTLQHQRILRTTG